MNRLTKIWTGVGAFVAIGAGLSQVPQVAEAEVRAEQSLAEQSLTELAEETTTGDLLIAHGHASAEGGEGGEGG